MKQEKQTSRQEDTRFVVELLEERIAPRLYGRSINGPILLKPALHDDMIP